MPLPVLVIAWAALGLVTLLGLRLLRTALRGRKVPDFLMASFFLGGATLGYGGVLLRRTIPDASPEVLDALHQFSLAVFNVPVIAIALFTWLVFRAAAPWARRLALGLAAVIVLDHAWAYWIVPLVGPERFFSVEPGSLFYWLAALPKAVCFVWACVESAVYWRTARRRVRLGLADPLVTNRFLLWAVWSGAATGIMVLRLLSPLLFDAEDPTARVPLPLVLGQLVTGLTCAGAFWLTFSPPGFYRRFVAARAPATG